MAGPAGAISTTLPKAIPSRLLQARFSGLLCNPARGSVNMAGVTSPAYRFYLATSNFLIHDETAQLPPFPPMVEGTSGNVSVVDVVGPQAFVKELFLFFPEGLIVDLCGQFHTEPHPRDAPRLFCPSITLSLQRLQNTEDMLRILHAPNGNTKELQARLRRLIFSHDPLSCRTA
ncbi:hypothetical protein ABB37_09256 [Leptomonas pyrrhocoris]|uniref:Uncharacterized protein n=1 Tax=Leptomonas pyrrhocoris TaxID=157538 RepID=A0A0N0DR60_LEPPY|nr:hypothetical protein ABB37_09256 [Leptomonas pyrrhocoris]KPA74242.1 hypothetical protein ABB37_09256 [Leptomonas pyrrhocoris]|eukprot:XP_015652681.1 hypothetical protein ABB37_09256 [Leptomonas pyrrhocoris]